MSSRKRSRAFSTNIMADNRPAAPLEGTYLGAWSMTELSILNKTIQKYFDRADVADSYVAHSFSCCAK